eukprot:1157616-Pelagomonas_calceolata.AAC.2
MKHLLCDAGLEAFMHSVESVHLHTLMNSADALNVKWDYPLYHVAAHLRTRNRSSNATQTFFQQKHLHISSSICNRLDNLGAEEGFDFDTVASVTQQGKKSTCLTCSSSGPCGPNEPMKSPENGSVRGASSGTRVYLEAEEKDQSDNSGSMSQSMVALSTLPFQNVTSGGSASDAEKLAKPDLNYLKASVMTPLSSKRHNSTRACHKAHASVNVSSAQHCCV